MENKLRAIIADDVYLGRTTTKYMINDNFPLIGVDTVDNGSALVEKVKEHNYLFAIVDGCMPNKGDGLSAVRQIRAQGLKLKICMFSGDKIGKEAIEAGADDFIEKTLECYFLLEKVIRRYVSNLK